METWFLLILITAFLAALLKAFLSPELKLKPPPGPRGVPIFSSLKWLGKSWMEIKTALISLQSKFGPIIRIPMGPLPSVIFVMDPNLAHEALVQKGAIFADRPKVLSTATNQLSITSSGYGPTWRALRRNLTSQILKPSRLKDYSHSRKWVLDVLTACLSSMAETSPIKVVDHFQFAMFSLLVLMCFGDKLEESKIKEIEAIQGQSLRSSTRFQVLNFWPRLTRVLLWRRWEELFNLRKKQLEILIPLIRARKDIVNDDTQKLVSSCYVDTLLNVEVEDHDSGSMRKLTEEELVSVCSEFLSAGTDTTMTALQWIMANLVKYPEIQARLYDEIRAIVGGGAEHVEEEDLTNMLYLKAIVLEGLRRHPPSHFVLPHSVTQDVELGGYVVPKNAVVNFIIPEIGWDPKVWENPMEFKPERFMPADEGKDYDPFHEFDVTGSREIRMMPFGAGRRICPALGMAVLHLEYFVANLVWKFKWATAEGHEVDLTEKQEFTVVMKHPLHARISPR